MVDGEKSKSSLDGRFLYVPWMSYEGSKVFTSACKSVGIEARLSPKSDERTMELGSRYTSGDECYPEKVTLGGFLRAIEIEGPDKVAFFLPTSCGPCRFGQYAPYLKKILKDMGYDNIPVISPSSSDSYEGVGEYGDELVHTGWRALIASDILRKMLMKTRPYELHPGQTDEVMMENIDDVCRAVELRGIGHKKRLKEITLALTRSRDRFRAIPVDRSQDRPLIGVVGEIFCRLDTFSNEELVRKIEAYGGECWLSDVSEWIWHTNFERMDQLRRDGKRFSKDMLYAKIKNYVQKKEEHTLYGPLKEDLRGYEEAEETTELLEYSEPYLPYWGALGEMVLSVGKAIYLYKKGADGIVDISPFTCMNGIICEAVYPKVSSDHDSIPIRIFYFDGTQSDLDRDIGIFMELVQNYRRRKRQSGREKRL